MCSNRTAAPVTEACYGRAHGTDANPPTQTTWTKYPACHPLSTQEQSLVAAVNACHRGQRRLGKAGATL